MKVLTIGALSAMFLVPGVGRAEDKADIEKMQGEWKTVTAKRGGKDAPPAILKSRLIVTNNMFTLEFADKGGDRERSSIRIMLHPSKSPKQIDFLEKDGTVDSIGIYKLEGKKLTICFDRKKQPRPKKFESKQNTRVTLMVFERTK